MYKLFEKNNVFVNIKHKPNMKTVYQFIYEVQIQLYIFIMKELFFQYIHIAIDNRIKAI